MVRRMAGPGRKEEEVGGHAGEKVLSTWLPRAFVERFNAYCAARKHVTFRKTTIREIVYEFLTDGMMRHPVTIEKKKERK